MAWKQIHGGRRAALGAVLPALVVVAGISAWVLRTGANPVVRTVPVGFWINSLVVDESIGRAFIDIYDASGHSRIEMLDATTGAIVRTITMPGWAGPLAVDEQTARLVAATSDGVRVLDARNGTLVRVVHLSPPPNAVVVDARAGRIYVANSGGTTCFNQTCTTSDGALAVLDARTGRLLHTTTLHHQGWTTLALDRRAHHLLVTSGVGVIGKPGAVSIFDTASGRLLYRTPLTPGVWPSPVVDEVTGRAFLVSYGGRMNAGMNAGGLEVLDTHSGRLLHTVTVGVSACVRPSTGSARNPIPLAIDEGAQRVFVATGTVFGRRGNFPPHGTLSVLDACSGSVLRTYPVGTDPSAVAVDKQRGRVFVLNRISHTVTVLGATP